MAKYPHLSKRNGNWMVTGTDVTVADLAKDKLVHGLSLGRIKKKHRKLTYGQICMALAYYYDHTEK